MVADAEQPSGSAEEDVGQAQSERAPAGADGVEQVHHPLARDRGGHGNFGRIEGREAGADRLAARDNAAYTGAYIISPFVAENLQRHSRSNTALEGRIGGVFVPGFGERSEKAARRRTEADADDVDFHYRSVDLRGFGRLGFHAHAG